MSSVNATTFSRQWESARRAIAAKGEPIVVRHRTAVETKTGPNAGVVSRSPLSTASLLASGAFLAGVSVVNLDADVLTGLLVANDTLLFAGHSQVYTVTGGPYGAAGHAVTGVGISPVLAENVADNEAVSVTFAATDFALVGLFTRSKMRMVDGQLTRVGDYRIFVSQKAIDAAGVVPERGDEVYRGATVAAGRKMAIVDLEPIVSEAAVYLVVEES